MEELDVGRVLFYIPHPRIKVRAGISYDITNAVARRLGLKVEWVEEVSFVTMAANSL